MEIAAQQIAPRAQTWLQQGWQTPPTLQLFDHVSNLINEKGQILSLVTADLGPNPLAIVIPNLSFPDWVAQNNAPISLGTPTTPSSSPDLMIGNLTIKLATAVAWHPIPPWHNPLDLHLIYTIVTNHPDFETGVSFDLATQMQQALYNNDQTLITQTASQLAGLGPGLTPAGDDFLVGVMYALFSKQWAVDSNQFISPTLPNHCSLITAAAMPRTTTLSANLLQAAGQGEASAAWHELLAARGETAVYTALTRILHTGHSSGSDALLGFLLGRTLANS